VVLLSAAKSGLFDIISHKKRVTINEIVRHFKWSNRGAEILLNALCSLKYLKKINQYYQIASDYTDMFSQDNYFFIKEWLDHEWRLLNRWTHLSEVLRTGQPYREPEKKATHFNHRNFILSMAHREKENMMEILKNISLKGYKHLLDLGGGPGLFAIAFAEKYSQLSVTVFDTLETEPIAWEFIGKSPASNRINYMSGDFLIDDFGNNYDAVLLSSVLHIYSASQNVNLLKKVYDSLIDNGKVIIRDFLLNRNRTGPVIGTLFAVNMLINTENGNAHTHIEMKNWLREVGFKKIVRKKLMARMDLIEAIK
jgi:SAM-dependent methyltransferase